MPWSMSPSKLRSALAPESREGEGKALTPLGGHASHQTLLSTHSPHPVSTEILRKEVIVPQMRKKASEKVRDLPEVPQVTSNSWNSNPGLSTPITALGSDPGPP